MASGDVVGLVLQEMPPAASSAGYGNRAGGSTPAENVVVREFNASIDEFVDYLVALEGYDGGGIGVEVAWMGKSAITGDVVWQVAIRRLQEDADDIDVSHTYDFNAVTATTASATGEVRYDSVTFTHGTDMDSWADGERAIVRVGRDADNASDTMTGDAQLLGPPVIRES